jgi:hypothetical protein
MEETANTIQLLFPTNDKTLLKWLDKEVPPFVDRRLMRLGTLTTDERQIENFRYWQRQLIVLKQSLRRMQAQDMESVVV